MCNTKSRNGIMETESEYGICEKRFQVTDLEI